jgi:hypothetical protein
MPKRPYHGEFGFRTTPGQFTAYIAPTLSQQGYRLVSQSPEMAIFEHKPPSAANVLMFGPFGSTRAQAIHVSYRVEGDLTHVTVDAESPGIGKLFEQLRPHSEPA